MTFGDGGDVSLSAASARARPRARAAGGSDGPGRGWWRQARRTSQLRWSTVVSCHAFYQRFSRHAAARHPRRARARRCGARVLRAEGSPRRRRVRRRRRRVRSVPPRANGPDAIAAGAARGAPQPPGRHAAAVDDHTHLGVPVPVFTFLQPRRLSPLELPFGVALMSEVPDAGLVAMEVPEHDAADSWFTDYAWRRVLYCAKRSGGAAAAPRLGVRAQGGRRRAGPGELRRADRSPGAGGRAVRGRACAKECSRASSRSASRRRTG